METVKKTTRDAFGDEIVRLGGENRDVYVIDVALGKAHKILDGGDVSIIANGDTVNLALAAARELEGQGIGVKLFDMHTVKPVDVDAIMECVEANGRIVTVEDHNILNGLGSAVCEVVAEAGRGRVKRIGVRDKFGESAPYESLLRQNGITVECIVGEAKRLLGE